MSTTDPCHHGNARASCSLCIVPGWPVHIPAEVMAVQRPEPIEVRTHRPLELPALPVGTALETPRRVYGVPPSQTVRADLNTMYMSHMIRTRRGAGPHL
jgi:hypothetical protein